MKEEVTRISPSKMGQTVYEFVKKEDEALTHAEELVNRVLLAEGLWECMQPLLYEFEQLQGHVPGTPVELLNLVQFATDWIKKAKPIVEANDTNE